MLFLVATPIGNLLDITLRAIESLKACDYILCEDTRHSAPLLKQYDIHTALKSFHKFSEASKEPWVIGELKAGKKIALISDAGTPGISDPGARLVQRCIEEHIPVIPIPGACAAVTALSASGLSTERFQFYGFLPKKTQELRRCLQDLLSYPGTTVCYESPHRLEDVLKEIHSQSPQRLIVIARELTKTFEEFVRGTAQDILTHFSTHTLKGEIVLLIGGKPPVEGQDWTHLSPKEHVMYLQTTYGLTKQEAIKSAAELRGVPKREIYNQVIHDIE